MNPHISFKLNILAFVVLLAMLIGLGPVTNAQAGTSARPLFASGDLLWGHNIGGNSGVDAYDKGFSIGADSSGNVYTMGVFGGTVDFDPGAGTTSLTSIAASDIFILKMDNDGNFIWVKQIAAGGASQEHEYHDLAVDASGNAYITSYFKGTVDFDPGAGTFNLLSDVSQNPAYVDIFVLKLDTNGDFVWAKKMGGAYYDRGNGIAVDSTGNVYTTGEFQATADFDPGAGTANLTSAGAEDVFVSKLDSNGDFVWAKKMGGTSYDYGRSIAVDSSGNVYTTGQFSGPADYDPGAGVVTLTPAVAGNWTVFVSKLDSNGDYVWAEQLAGVSESYGRGIAVDSSGNVYTTGSFRVNGDFDPGAGTATLTSNGGADIFLSKLDSNGDYLWALNIGGTSDDLGHDVAVDSSGNVYTTGSFNGTVDFDPGASTFSLTGVGNAYISKFSDSGGFAWAKKYGDATGSIGFGVALDSNANLLATGNTVSQYKFFVAKYEGSSDTTGPETNIDTTPPDPDNDQTPTFTFSGTDDTGVASFMCQIDSGGFSACSSPFTLPTIYNGMHTFEVYAIDNALNPDTTPASYSWTVDTLYPSAYLDSEPDSPSNDTTAIFTFHGTDTGSGIASFLCKMDAGTYSPCTSPFTSPALAEGEHYFYVKAVDNAGNVGTYIASGYVLIDTTPPTTTIDSGPSGIKANATASFNFSGDDSVSPWYELSYFCKVDDGSYGPCTSVHQVTLADGPHQFYVYAVDEAGNADASPASRIWYVDTTPPDTNIDLQPSDPSDDITPTFTFSTADYSPTYQCKMDGGSYIPCTSPFTSSPLYEGAHTFFVRATDGVGNVETTPASYTWLVDTTAPTVSIDSQPSNPSSDNTPTFTFSGSDFNGIAGFECQIDSGGYAPCASPFTSAVLSDGLHSFRVKSRDNAGQYSGADLYTWTVDTTPATVVSITREDANPNSSPLVEFRVEFSESVTGVDISDFSLTQTGVHLASIVSVSPYAFSEEIYEVIVDPGVGEGTLGLNLVDDDSILEHVSLPLYGAGTGTVFTGETYQTLGRPIVSAGFYDDETSAWRYSGTWLHRPAAFNAYEHSYSYTTATGASATVYFTGGQVKLTYIQNPTAGSKLRVYIDGTQITELNLFSLFPRYFRTWYSPISYADGFHNVRFVRVGGEVNVDAIEIIPPPDNVPPAMINSLSAASGASYGQVNLQWTAVGDNGNTGTATSYQVRYLRAPIKTETAWNSATPVTSGVPVPSAPGTVENMNVSGLTPSLVYYFAVRAVDDKGNLGPLSNDPSAVALAPSPVGAGTYDNLNSNWILSGSWVTANVAGATGGNVHTTSTVRSNAVLVFNGSGFTLRYFTLRGYGSLDVYVDGVKVATINQNRVSLTPIWRTYVRSLTPGPHVIQIVNASGKVNFDSIVIAP